MMFDAFLEIAESIIKNNNEAYLKSIFITITHMISYQDIIESSKIKGEIENEKKVITDKLSIISKISKKIKNTLSKIE
jgi:hypothetical protein